MRPTLLVVALGAAAFAFGAAPFVAGAAFLARGLAAGFLAVGASLAILFLPFCAPPKAGGQTWSPPLRGTKPIRKPRPQHTFSPVRASSCPRSSHCPGRVGRCSCCQVIR